MQVGDVYRNNPLVYSGDEQKRREDFDKYGTGPFEVIKIEPIGVYCKSLEDGRSHGPWSTPDEWGVLDVFLTAAHKANHERP